MDDEPEVRRVATRLLELQGHEVTQATDGDEALDLYQLAHAEGRPHDLLILDLTVPGSPGGAVTLDRIQELDPEVPAIVTSGYRDHPAMCTPRRFGFRTSLAKPFHRDELKAILDRWCPLTAGD